MNCNDCNHLSYSLKYKFNCKIILIQDKLIKIPTIIAVVGCFSCQHYLSCVVFYYFQFTFFKCNKQNYHLQQQHQHYCYYKWKYYFLFRCIVISLLLDSVLLFKILSFSLSFLEIVWYLLHLHLFVQLY